MIIKVFEKSFCFSENLFQSKSIEKVQKSQWLSHADLSNGELFWISPVPCFRRTYALSIGIKMKPVKKGVKNSCKNCWKERPFLSVHLLSHLFQTYMRQWNMTSLTDCVKVSKRSEPTTFCFNKFLYWIEENSFLFEYR